MVTQVLRPDDPAGVAAVLRDARTVVIRGAGTKQSWGGSLPSTVDVVVETTRLSGVVSHEPGDRVVTVRAGTRLRDLQALLGLTGQRLAVESGHRDATVGGVLASGEAGPLRLRYGSGRDLVLGVQFVRADGVVARSGGKVVKNVAGYDLGRLLCGSYGTLGVVTEATLKLHPLPAASAWVVAPLATIADIVRLVEVAESPSVVPSAVEMHWSTGSGSVAVLVEGSRSGVRERAEALRRLLGQPDAVLTETPPQWWGTYPFGDGDIGLRLAAPVSLLPEALGLLLDRLGDAVTLVGSAGCGVLHAGVAPTAPADAVMVALRGVRALLSGNGGTCVVVTAPPSIRDGLDLWGSVAGIGLMRRVKKQFDPTGRFAPGRFVGGI